MFKIELLGNKQLILQSNYQIIKNMIPKEDYNKLKQLNEQADESRNMKLLVKLMDPCP